MQWLAKRLIGMHHLMWECSAHTKTSQLSSLSSFCCSPHQVKSLLQRADNVDIIIQAVPELSDPATLNRSLGYLAASFPGQDPVALLQENPTILLNLGESNVEDSAEVSDHIKPYCTYHNLAPEGYSVTANKVAYSLTHMLP